MTLVARWLALLPFVTLPLGTLPLGAQDSPADELRHAIERCARGTLDEGAEGLALAVDVGGELVYAGGFGLSDPERGTAADASAAFRAGPLFGSFLAVVALRLAERGELELAAPLSKYLPELYARQPEITVDRLLTHTSGIPSYGALLEAAHHQAKPFEPEPILAWLAEAPLEAQPGTCASYSNTNDLLLGLVLEKVGKASVRELLERELLEPAGMVDTNFCFERPALREAAHVDQEFGAGEALLDGAPPPFGAEGLCTSAIDLVRFQRALLTDALLGEELRTLRGEPARLADGERTAVGRGVNLTSLGDLARQTAGGGMARFRAHLAFYPGMDATIVVLASGLDAPAEALERSVARLLFDLERHVPEDLELAAEERARYLGDYYAGCTSYGVTEVGTHLVLVLPGGERRVLLSQGDGRFESAEDPDLRVIFELEEGRPIALLLTERGVTLRAVRMR